MSSPDADDASPSPEHSGDQGEGDMAEQKLLRAEGNGPQSQAGNGQKPNAKDPQRPRRKKARRACFACQRAHLTCGKHSLTHFDAPQKVLVVNLVGKVSAYTICRG